MRHYIFQKLILSLFLFTGLAFGQIVVNPGSNGAALLNTTVAGLASVPGKVNGTLVTIHDGSTTSDCLVGGGANAVTCIYNGSAWSFAGNSGSTPTFAQVGAGTSTAALVVGTGGTLAPSGTGTITATNGQTAAGFAPTTDGIFGVNTTSHLPVFGSNGTTLIWPQSKTNPGHNFLTTYTQTSGLFTQAQPLCADISDATTLCSTTPGTGVATFLTTPSSANLLAAMTTSTGTGNVVFATNPVLVTPNLGTPSAGVMTNVTGLPISTGVSGLGTGVATFLGTPSSANFLAALTTSTGTGNVVFATNPVLVTPNIGTPSGGVLTNTTGLPISTGVSGLGTGVATFLGTPSSANLLAALTTSTGTGNTVFSISPALTGTPDASGATQFKLPVAAGFAAIANGECGYDTTNQNWHCWNGADKIIAPLAAGFVSGHCGQLTATAGKWEFVDTGAACGTAALSGMTAGGLAIAATPTTVSSSTTPGTSQGTYFYGHVNPTNGSATTATEIQAGDCTNGGASVTGSTTYSVAFSDLNCMVTHDSADTNAVVVTIPTPTTLNNSRPIFIWNNNSPQIDTLTPTTFTIAMGSQAAAASIPVPSNTSCKVSLDPKTPTSVWKADCHPMMTNQFNPALLGSTIAGTATTGIGTPICMVDGVTNKKLQDCVEYFTSQSLSTGTIYDFVPEDFLTNPFPTSFAGRVWLMNDRSGTTCNGTTSANIVCWVFEYPLVLSAGLDIHGIASVTAANNFATGTAITFGSNYKAAFGAPAAPTFTCISTGGTIGTGNFPFQVEWVNNLQTYSGSASSTNTPGYSAPSTEFIVNCPSGSTNSITVTSPSAVSAGAISASDFLILSGPVSTLGTEESGCSQVTQNCATQNITCGANGVGTVDPTGCKLGSTATVTAIASTANGGNPPMLVDTSNCLVVYARGNRQAQLQFGVTLHDLSIAGSQSGTNTSAANEPSCGVVSFQGQEQSGIDGVNINGPWLNTGWYQATDSVNNSIRNSQIGGGDSTTTTYIPMIFDNRTSGNVKVQGGTPHGIFDSTVTCRVSGAVCPEVILVDGPKANLPIIGSHLESNAGDIVVTRNGADVDIFGGAWFNGTTGLLAHNLSTGGHISVYNVHNAVGGAATNMIQDDAIPAGTGNCNSNNSFCSVSNTSYDSQMNIGVFKALQMSVTTPGAASSPAVTISGAPFTGGSGTTTFPLFYVNSGASAPSTWSTSGTILGFNAPSGFGGNYLDFHTNGGGSLFSVSSGGVLVANGTIQTKGAFQLSPGRLVDSSTAPTISSGFGTSNSIAASNGTAAFTVNVGTGGVATSGVIGLPAATTGWKVDCNDITTTSATVFVTKQTATTTTTATVGNFSTSGTAAAWVASDVLSCMARAY